ncbi:VTT domain-containing protein [Actinoplanes sp. NPDC051411]|uniref:TVP38/TMEM64 family protein n=1 Tax=Actinoplanes sp. NPDC051411 TaxID=3155522 RepID=UPI003432EC55
MTDTLIAPSLPSTAPASVGSPMGWKRRLIRFAVLGVVVGGLAFAAAVLPLREIGDAVMMLGRTGAAVAIAVVGGLLLSVMVPRTAITIACGALLGAATGAAAALAAAVIAAIATYYAGRWAGRGALKAKSGSKLARLDGWLDRRGLSAVLLVRLLPLAPYGLVGYAYGTTSVCRKRYLLGTTLAAIPSAISYAVIGAAVTKPHEMNPLTLAPALVGFALTTAIVWRWKRSARRPAAPVAA